MVIVGQTKRTASIHADNQVKCWILHASDLDSLANLNPHLKIIILKNLALSLGGNLKKSNELISILAR